ncbi:MAG: hypothetical protein GX434_17160 [Peptococcaceae bacterium]|nr:hypothetical protein [Peptococcaceae bacterium]
MALPDGSSSCLISALFDSFPIGRLTSIGVPNGFWTGGYGSFRDGVAFLTNAQLFDNSGTAVGAVQLVVNIPIAQITYVV